MCEKGDCLRRLFLHLSVGFVLIIVLAVTGTGQTGMSRITGTVTDPTGAVIEGATVTAKNEATGVQYKATTTSAGTYAIESVPVGSYTITVEAPGFRTFTSSGNVVNVGAALVVNAQLQVGQATEVIEVVGAYERVETTHAMISDVVTRRAVADLPLNGRNPLSLIVLQPGLVQRTTNSAGSGTHVFGSRDRAHNVTVDGIDANESSVPNPQSNILRLNPDNVQEYRVVTHNATPEYGRNSGANVSIATRSGTNEYHADLFYFHRNTVLNANEFFNKAEGQPKPVLLLHQFGAAGGGPITKNKTFFFASYQGNRIMQTQPIAKAFGTPLAYTATMRSGIYRFVRGAITVDGVTVTRNSPLLVDASGNLKPGVPVCGGSVTTNCVDSYNIFDPRNDPRGIGPDPVIRSLINQFPLPNTFSVGDGLNIGGFVWNPPSRFVGPNSLVRVDHKFSENHTMFGRFIWSDWDTKEGDFLNARPQVFPGFPPMGEVFRSNQNLAISYRSVLSDRTVNEFTTGFNRFRFFFTWGESNPNFGDFTKVPPYGQECAGTNSFRNIDTPFCNTPHTARAVSTIQFIDNLSYVRGSHTIRTGINFRFYRHNDSRGFAGGRNISPNIFFDQSLRRSGFLNLPPVGGGADQIDASDNTILQNALVEWAGIVAGVDQAFAADLKGNSFPPGILQVLGTRAKQFNFYAQDEWRIRRNLTMTYGVRWELNLPMKDCCDRVFVPDKPIDGSQGPITFVARDRWYERTNWRAFGPRVSFAWSPWGEKTVFRLGYGLAFDPISTFQVTAIGGMVPGSALDCRMRLSDTPTGVQATITTGCSIPANIDRRIGQGFPLQLPTPTARPSELFSPPAQPLGVAPNTGAFDPNLKLPAVHEWSLTIQRELPGNMVVQVGYIGKRGTHLFRAYDLNQIRTDQPGFKESFLIAQENLRKGCRPDGTGCPAGVTGVTPTLLLQLTGSTPGDPRSFLNSSTTQTNLLRNGLGDLAVRIDSLTGASWIVNRGFPANYFRPNPQFSQIFYFDSGGDSYYHGMIVQLRRRFEKGLDLGFSYTLSKSIDNMSVDPVGAASGGGLSTTNSRTPTDVRNFRLDRSLSDFDNRHVFVVHGLYDLPFGRGRTWGGNWPGVVNHILGGWTVTGIFISQSGEPFTINSGIRTVHNTKQSRAELRGPLPKAKLQSVAGIRGPVVFQVTDLDPNTNCRQIVGTQSFLCIPAPGESGMGRNTIIGPGFWNFDFGLIKRITLTERVNLQFRAEFFNAFNHPNFENPRNASSGSPTLTSSLFGQTCCVTAAVPASATIIAVGEPNRVIQFAFKLSF
ncbi:MAG TPA: TonB-dependent receptor [Blastocatellia bacterium]|nr:TonB-dependent receptor [Blastocatellia bacterium]